jgi:hypothetical protein
VGPHREYYSSSNGTVVIVYRPDLVSAWDYGGVAAVLYSPPAGTVKEVLKPFDVSVTAVDKSGNTASCSFAFVVGSEH